MKLVLALWDADQQALLGAELRAALRELGVTKLQVNLDDELIPDTVLRLQAFDVPLTSVVSVWTDSAADAVVKTLDPYAARLAGWQVEEREPLVPPGVPEGERMDALSQVAFLRRPAEMKYADWRAHWQGPHTQIAIETQATFGYVQNRVTGTLTDDTPHVDAIVEELFRSEAMHDIHAFYGSNGDQEELDRRLTRLMASVSTMGADRDLDVVPTSRYVFGL
jgi:EthD domain